MATTYVVLQEGGSGDTASYRVVADTVLAASAEAARRRVAEELDRASSETALSNEGVTLIAVPERNWRTGRGTLKAETQRRIRSA